MRQPFISPTYIREDGSKFYYVETDVQVTNLLRRYTEVYGATPFVYYKYSNSLVTPNAFGREGTKLFLRNPGQIPGWSFQDIGDEVSRSNYCGNEQKRVFNLAEKQTIERFGPDREKTVLVSKQISEDAIQVPELRRAGVVNMGFGGANTTRRDGGTTDGVGFLARSSSVQVFDYDVLNIEILNAWNKYVEAKARLGETQAFQVAGIKIRDTKGQEVDIKTLDQLQKAFPKWFLINNEILSSSLAAIVGDSGLTQIAGKMYPKSYVGLWQKFAEQGLSEKEVVAELQKQGYTTSQINATRIASGQSAFELRQFAYNAFATGQMNLAPLSGSNNPNDPGGGGSNGSGSGGGSAGVNGGARAQNGQPWFGPEGYRPGEIQQLTVNRSRNIFLSADEIRNIVSYEGAEQIMYQVYIGSIDSEGRRSPILTQYKFDFAPNEINYSGFGGEWTSIERNGSFPMIDWKSFKLLQISFSFVIANNNGDLTADGLELPVTEQIETLQRMAQAPYPVMFYGFDTLLTNQFRYDSSGKPRGVQFVIQDLSITSQRRNTNMEITRAQAQITLQEIPIETTSVIGMPRLKHKPERPKVPTNDETDLEFGLFTSNLTIQGTDTLTYRT